MRSQSEWRQAAVASVDNIAEDVRRVVFDVTGEVPKFDAGSHLNIRVTINDQPAIRTYTVVPSGPGQLAIAVKLHPQSRGGSHFIWGLKPGDGVALTLPENRFELSWRAGHYLLLAGGIGITPIYGMARALAAHGTSLKMCYGALNRASMPYLSELETLLGDRLAVFEAERDETIDLQAEIDDLPEDGELYVCGPLGMLEAVKRVWAASGRPVSRLRYEVFGDNGKFAEATFEVEVRNRNITVTVPPDKTLLDALEEAGVETISDCRRGECGLCAVGIDRLDGEVDHRDVFFSDEEKAGNKAMCACVSRLVSGRAVIDIGYRA
ncbi:MULTISPECIES: PDR/VanB family oxidoreductase [Alphaproteobacteria]|uniref:Diguanylate cyclase n=2 Tax=Alphaproteobacteria TaxID=28211 RepID=A0A512HH44_9HYPH|nr:MULTISPECIES: PDR/VanB family oxidoreductase [Alphaproteobacteria]GEO84768.1 diguanylate cyclase [Ciceribacter naphthalenivorans]GLR20611.1 diguanylate cyclase [Ciceribacter naphthalenivorans]GLT03467.1 diguanylate cyclase [Sphingomonas psychrolutea]